MNTNESEPDDDVAEPFLDPDAVHDPTSPARNPRAVPTHVSPPLMTCVARDVGRGKLDGAISRLAGLGSLRSGRPTHRRHVVSSPTAVTTPGTVEAVFDGAHGLPHAVEPRFADSVASERVCSEMVVRPDTDGAP